MSIKDLVLKWIIIAKSLYKILKKKKIRELLNKLLKDTDILNIYTEEMEKCGMVNTSITLTI